MHLIIVHQYNTLKHTNSFTNLVKHAKLGLDYLDEKRIAIKVFHISQYQ